jgi:hypothetical protein
MFQERRKAEQTASGSLAGGVLKPFNSVSGRIWIPTFLVLFP